MDKHHTQNEEPISLTPEEMKAIGEIELGPSRHEQFLNSHYKKLIVAAVAFMLLVSAAIVFITWRNGQESNGAASLVSAIKSASSEGAVSAADYDAATLAELPAKYSGTHAAVTSELLRGMQLIEGGQEQEGAAILEAFINSTDVDILRVRAQAFLAGHYMSGDEAQKQKALTLWQAVSRAGFSPYLALSYLTLGDIAKEAGEIEQARGYYNKLQADCPNSPLTAVAQQRLLILGVDAPVPVEPTPVQQNDNTPKLQEWQSPSFSTGAPQ